MQKFSSRSSSNFKTTTVTTATLIDINSNHVNKKSKCLIFMVYTCMSLLRTIVMKFPNVNNYDHFEVLVSLRFNRTKVERQRCQNFKDELTIINEYKHNRV